MKLVYIDDIVVPARQRSSIAAGPLNELRDSILRVGLLHPPVCWQDESKKWILTVGERRLEAIRQIYDDDGEFYYSGLLVPKMHLPITPLGEYLDSAGRFEAELDENLQRVDLEWQDRARALSSLHQLRKQENPKQTALDTGQELAAKAIYGSAKSAQQRVIDAVIVTQHLDNEKVAKSRNLREAVAQVYKIEEEKIRAALIGRALRALPEKPDLEVRLGNLFVVLPSLERDTFDLILGDPPYGLGAGGSGFRARTVHHHNYADTIDDAKAVAQCILTEGFRVAKARANILLFCDIRLFDWLKTAASNMGWSPFDRPLIWQKSESEGLAPWGAQGPRITTEFMFYATKGQRGMNASPTDLFNVKRVPRHERLHGAEKPVELLRKLIEVCTLPGDSVLDPCCGSGSTLVACRESKRRGLGVEKDPDYYNTALSNVHWKETTDDNREAEEAGA